MRTPDADRVRLVIQGLSVGGKKNVTNALVFEALGCAIEPEKARVRRQINDMVRRQELTRVEDGVFTYNPKAVGKRQAEYLHRIWRAIRSAKPGFGCKDLASVTRASYTHVMRYCAWLKEDGYLEPHGMRGQTRLYRATEKARQQVETPFPPRRLNDPFDSPKREALELVRLFLMGDPYQPAVRTKIVENCRAILARFEKEESEDGHKVSG